MSFCVQGGGGVKKVQKPANILNQCSPTSFHQTVVLASSSRDGCHVKFPSVISSLSLNAASTFLSFAPKCQPPIDAWFITHRSFHLHKLTATYRSICSINSDLIFWSTLICFSRPFYLCPWDHRIEEKWLDSAYLISPKPSSSLVAAVVVVMLSSRSVISSSSRKRSLDFSFLRPKVSETDVSRWLPPLFKADMASFKREFKSPQISFPDNKSWHLKDPNLFRSSRQLRVTSIAGLDTF